jgi:hypothetical protein
MDLPWPEFSNDYEVPVMTHSDWRVDRAPSAAAKSIAAGVAALMLWGCGIASAPIKPSNQVVATPQQGQLSVSVAAQPSVGNVIPVYVSVANGTYDPRAVIPTQVFAINDAGERVAPLPPGEAARQAGNAGELRAAIVSSAASGAAAGAMGAGLGALAGAATGGVGTGAIVGTATGAGWGMFEGAQAGQGRADQQAGQQIESLALRPADVNRNFTVSGYVFYPKGHYQRIEMVMVDRETGDTQTISEPWR